MKRLAYLLVGGLLFFSPPVFAGVREDVLAAMRRCSPIQNDRTWLDCTYGAQQLMRAKLGLTPASEFQQRLVPPASIVSANLPASTVGSAMEEAPPLPRRKEGLFQVFSGRTPPTVTSVLVGVRYDDQGGFIATLQNGQVWRQVNLVDGTPKARLTLGSKVTILRGAMWSYDLKLDNNPRTFKVDREA